MNRNRACLEKHKASTTWLLTRLVLPLWGPQQVKIHLQMCACLWSLSSWLLVLIGGLPTSCRVVEVVLQWYSPQIVSVLEWPVLNWHLQATQGKKLHQWLFQELRLTLLAQQSYFQFSVASLSICPLNTQQWKRSNEVRISQITTQQSMQDLMFNSTHKWLDFQPTEV